MSSAGTNPEGFVDTAQRKLWKTKTELSEAAAKVMGSEAGKGEI